MSEQSLRAALEKALTGFRTEYPKKAPGWAYVTLLNTLASLLAAHPAAPVPLLDREAVRSLIGAASAALAAYPDRLDFVTDAVMELARPMPTREQISEAIMAKDLVLGETSGPAPGSVDHCRALADAVLALLNGTEA